MGWQADPEMHCSLYLIYTKIKYKKNQYFL
jgi:hypothetical protein